MFFNTKNKILLLLFFLSILILIGFPNLTSVAHASGPTYITGPISSDTTWTIENSPYVIQGPVSILSNITLTVQPGVVVKFAYTSSALMVYGNLNSQGTASQPVYFTSLKDDSVGGDTNGDGSATQPAPYDWSRLYFPSGSQGNLSHSIIRYGGQASEVKEDQKQLNITDYYSIGSSNYQWVAQSFKPGNSSWKKYGLWLCREGNFNDVYGQIGVYFCNGFSAFGTCNTPFELQHLDASTTNSLIPLCSSGPGYVSFTASSTIGVTPGQTYSMVLNNVNVGLRVYYASGNPYPNGHVHLRNIWAAQTWSQDNDDLYFITYSGINAAGVFIKGGNVTISDSRITNNGSTNLQIEGGSLTVNNSEIDNSKYGVYLSSGTATINNSSLHDIVNYGVYNTSPTTLDARNNWWGHSSGPYHPISNPNGSGVRVGDRVNFIPWLGYDPTVNQPPTFSNLNQYKSDGLTIITEGQTTTESTVVFKAIVSDPDNDKVKLQVELKEYEQNFDGQNIIESDFIDSGSETVVTRFGLVEGQYNWRARAIDEKGVASDWQEFGEIGNVDFEVKLVPLYTQVRSLYPSDEETKVWAELDYAKGVAGNYNCGSKIRECGCAITSAVMVARFYKVTETQWKDVNPGEINDWLENEPIGYVNGDVNWIAVAKYTNWRIKYEKTNNTTNDYTILDEKLNNNQPVIVKAKAGRGGKNLQHFFVIDGKLVSTYTVKDPAWYNTKMLNETTDINNQIRGYENGFDGLRIYKKGDGIAQSAIIFALGSPAELLITDSLGRKLGKDQNDIEYSEIPNASYFEDGFDDPTGENPSAQERNKLIQILEPFDGQYQIQVIGTGSGTYFLQSGFYDTQGDVNTQQFQSETTPGYTAQYNISFNSSNSASTTIEIFDETPPESEIYFNTETQRLEIKGIDNTTVHPIVSIIESGNDEKDDEKEIIYQIQDEAGNITKLFFDELKQRGKEIKAELRSIQYNDNPAIELYLPETELKYEWSLDKKTNQIKELEQRVEVDGQFEIKAKYYHKKDETTLKVELQDQEEIKQTLQGLIIVKLITKSGVLDFGFEYGK